MKSGKLTKDIWSYDEVKPGDLVKDNTGRIYRVLDVVKTGAPAIQGNRLEVING